MIVISDSGGASTDLYHFYVKGHLEPTPPFGKSSSRGSAYGPPAQAATQAQACQQLVAIPMAGRVPCLNVSVAAGVTLFEAVRQRS